MVNMTQRKVSPMVRKPEATNVPVYSWIVTKPSLLVTVSTL
uniref:Uncharacterized protein n=1 Tax=Anguilla anguilla TaxID=7936 RepID=A0A0E9UFM2_ANGAN